MNPNKEVLSRVLATSVNAVEVPVLTPQEIRAEIARERREAERQRRAEVKARDLKRKQQRANKRSQAY